MMRNSFLLDIATSFQGIVWSMAHSCLLGLIMRYFTFSMTVCISALATVSTRYSFTFSLFHLCMDTRKLSISASVTESSELSKNRIVKRRKQVMITPSMITANPAFRLRITQARSSHESAPIPKVILLRARIFPYSLGSAWERT